MKFNKSRFAADKKAAANFKFTAAFLSHCAI